MARQSDKKKAGKKLCPAANLDSINLEEVRDEQSHFDRKSSYFVTFCPSFPLSESAV